MTAKMVIRLKMRPRKLPIGAVRSWAAGLFRKVGPSEWKKVTHPQDALQEIGRAAPRTGHGGGIIGLARAISRAQKQKKTNLAEAYRALASALGRTAINPFPLNLTVEHIIKDGGGDMSWKIYCARRWAAFNDDWVDLGALDSYVDKAKAYHGTKYPPGVSDPFEKAYTGPRTVADVNLATWMEFFHEGGQLNEPYWMVHSQRDALRHQFEALANLHGGSGG